MAKNSESSAPDSGAEAEVATPVTVAPVLFYFAVTKKNESGQTINTGRVIECDEKWLDVYSCRPDLIQVPKP